MTLTTKLADARGALLEAGWSEEDILEVIPVRETSSASVDSGVEKIGKMAASIAHDLACRELIVRVTPELQHLKTKQVEEILADHFSSATASLLRDNQELKEDKKRLDYLIKERGFTCFNSKAKRIEFQWDTDNFQINARQAIDSALSGEKNKANERLTAEALRARGLQHEETDPAL